MHHFHLIRFMLTRELSEIYASIAVRTLANTMINIFVPIYLLIELNYPFSDVCIFYIAFFIVMGLFAPIAGKISSRTGLKHSILLSSPITILYFVLLYFLGTYTWLFYPIAIIGAIANAIFWIAFHTDFALFSNTKHRGEETSLWYGLTLFISVIGPFLGGLVLVFLGFSVLFLIVSILFIVSAMPLFLSKEVHEPAPFSLQYILSKKHVRDVIAFIGYGSRYASFGILWPIFMFTALLGYVSIGAVFSIASIFTAVFAIYIGKLSDRMNKGLFIRIGSVLNALTWFTRIIMRTLLSILSIAIIDNITCVIFDIPMHAKIYDKARKNKRKIVEYLVFREMFLSIGRIIILLTALFVSLNAGLFFTGFTTLLQLAFW